MDKLLTPQQIADVLGVKISTIYQWTHQGFIPHVKLGRLVRFNETAVMKWVEERSNRGRTTRAITITDLSVDRMKGIR